MMLQAAASQYAPVHNFGFLAFRQLRLSGKPTAHQPREQEDGLKPLFAVDHIIDELSAVNAPIQENCGNREIPKNAVDEFADPVPPKPISVEIPVRGLVACARRDS